MTGRWRAAAEVLVAVLVAVAAVWSWDSGVQTARFGATADAPAFSSTSYSGIWILGAFVFAAMSSVLLIDALRRWSRC